MTHSLLQELRERREGFTLVEIMVVVGIIALLVSIGVPNFLRARKRTQATKVLSDLRMIDSAVGQYAVENNVAASGSVLASSLKVYVKTGSTLYDALSSSSAYPAGYGAAFSVDGLPKIPAGAWSAYSDVMSAGQWAPYSTN